MGLQDDIFDIDDALDGTPHHEAFTKMIRYMGRMEAYIELLRGQAVIYCEDPDGVLRRWRPTVPEDVPTILDTRKPDPVGGI